MHRNDRAGLERLARYGLRPPLALGRLTRASDGAVLYQMKRRFSDGTQTLRFVPQEFLLRLCALVPPPRFHRVRYAGLFAPNARGRRALTGCGPRRAAAPLSTITPTRPAATPAAPHPDAPDDPTRARRLDWATLLKRSFGIDALACPRCGHRMQLLATIDDPRVAEQILTHLGLPIRAPPPRRPLRRCPRSSTSCANERSPRSTRTIASVLNASE